MNPRLLVVSGPLKDSTFVLAKDQVTVGRDSANLLAISDPSLSRRHCLIFQDAEGYKIRDLESRNGTFVNGVGIKESRLQHGDQISAGDSVFVLLLRDDAAIAAADRVEFDDDVAQATEQLRPQDALYLQPERILRELPETERLSRNLNALLKISRMVHAIRDLDQLQAQVLASIFEVVPAERGAILMDGKEDEFESVFVRNRGGPTQPLRVSRTITRQVLEQKVAVLGSDVLGGGGFQKVESLLSSNVRSLLCVPLMMFQKVTSCIYLDTSNPASRFDQDHLQLVTALAGIAAVALENARRLQWLNEENLRLITEINLEHQLVGESACMKDVYSLLARVAPADSTVLIRGESGTGKELAARAIHRNSPRSEKPFVPIDCGAIPEGLIESELFGHEKGSFTGAVAQRKGKLEMAHGGVVFLDEVGDLSLSAQIKLLRVLQERKIERVGGEARLIPVDIRLVAATNKNLEEAVKAGSFRLDLFYRLNVVAVVMPPLRERRDDVPILAEYFVRKASKKCRVKAKKISLEAMACLANYDWPGNVRELENVIERALVLSTTETISPEDLPELILEKDPPPGVAAAKYHAAVKKLKQQLILNALDEAQGNYTEAARILGVHANYLHRLIRNLDLRETIKAGSEGRVQTKKFA